MSQTMDSKVFYGNLFKADKKPTKILDALLRGLAMYIAANIGDESVDCLTPAKLAAFYREVGGNYDSLFVDATHRTISYIYQTTGCQHSLQPTSDDYATPSVPALTPKGFARWQSIELLLDPQEHVEFMQRAVKSFPIKHPETGETFPNELPSTSLPAESDPQVARWHHQCAEKLRKEADPEQDDNKYNETPNMPPRPAQQPRYSQMRERSPKFHPDTKSDYFAAKPAPPQAGPSRTQSQRGPVRPTVDTRPGLYRSSHNVYGTPASPARESRPRRRSLQDENLSFSSPNLASPSPERPPPQKVPRGKSQPPYRHPSVSSYSSLSSNDSPQITPMPTHRRQSHPLHAPRETHNIRFNVGSVPPSPVGPRRSRQSTPRHSPRDSPHHSPRNSVHHSHDSSNTYDPRRQATHGDGGGSLSAQFLGPGAAAKRSNSRGTNVRWSAVDGVSEYPEGRRGSTSTDDSGRKRYGHGHSRSVGGRGRDEMEGGRARVQRRGSDERMVRETRRERDRERERRGASDGEEKLKGWKRFMSPVFGDSRPGR